jgi:N4-gp56 family major capsid protein
MAASYGPQGQDKLTSYSNTSGYAQQERSSTVNPLHTIKPDAYYDMMLLKMLRQMEFHYSKYAIQKSLPRNYGETINWRRFKKLDVADNRGLLNEGETPEGKTGIKGEEITAVIRQYGEVMYFTDLVDLQQLDDVRREYTIELGYIAQETLDLIVRDELVNGGSVYFANSLTSVTAVKDATSGARPTIDDFRKIVLGFKKDFVKGVRGAGGKYVALISPEVMFALFDDERMLQYMSFGQTNAPLADGVAIDMFGIRFEEVLNAPTIGNAHDSIVLADEAYAITKLAGEGNVRVITKGLGSAGVGDPLDQRQSIGYKITGFSAKVLRPESVVNYWANPTIASTVNLTTATQNDAAPANPSLQSAITVTFAATTTDGATIPSVASAVVYGVQLVSQALAGLPVAIAAGEGESLSFFKEAAASNAIALTDVVADISTVSNGAVTIYVKSAA